MKVRVEYNPLPLEIKSRTDESAAANLRSLLSFVEYIRNLPLRCDGVEAEIVNLAQSADLIKEGEESRWEPRVYFDEKMFFDKLPNAAEMQEALAGAGAHSKVYKPSKEPRLRVMVYYNSFPAIPRGTIGWGWREFDFTPKMAMERWLKDFYEAVSDFDEVSLELADISLMRHPEIPEFARNVRCLMVAVFNGKPVFAPQNAADIPTREAFRMEIRRWLNE